MLKVKLKDGTEILVNSWAAAKAALDYKAAEKLAETSVKASTEYLSAEVV